MRSIWKNMAEPHYVKQLLLSYRIGGRCHAFPQNLHLSLTQSCHRGAVLKLFHRHGMGRGVRLDNDNQGRIQDLLKTGRQPHCSGKFFWKLYEQDCIPVGCVPPARWPYLPACFVGGGVCLWGVSTFLGDICFFGWVPASGGGGVCS